MTGINKFVNHIVSHHFLKTIKLTLNRLNPLNFMSIITILWFFNLKLI